MEMLSYRLCGPKMKLKVLPAMHQKWATNGTSERKRDFEWVCDSFQWAREIEDIVGKDIFKTRGRESFRDKVKLELEVQQTLWPTEYQNDSINLATELLSVNSGRQQLWHQHQIWSLVIVLHRQTFDYRDKVCSTLQQIRAKSHPVRQGKTVWPHVNQSTTVCFVFVKHLGVGKSEINDSTITDHHDIFFYFYHNSSQKSLAW